MGKKPLYLLALISVFMFGCSSTKCRRYHNLSDATKTEWVGKEKDKQTLSKKIKIYKDNGSLQCGMGQAIDAEVMRKELGEIEVFSQESRSDGKMRIQVCGSPTGQINIYEIRQLDSDKATKLGFKLLEE